MKPLDPGNAGEVAKRLFELEQLQALADEAKTDFLSKMGWKYTSNYPDCCWRWSKTFEKGGQVTGDLDQALRLEVDINNTEMASMADTEPRTTWSKFL